MGKPDKEYITGVLGPLSKNSESDSADIDLVETGELNSDVKSDEGDHDLGPTTIVSSLLNPVLTPKKIPSTIGLSFVVHAPAKFKIDVCITWAKYAQNEDGKEWKRTPKYSIFSINQIKESDAIWINTKGELTSKQSAEISLHTYIEKLEQNTYHVSIYLVNRMTRVGKQITANCVFQPQIRVVCGNNIEIIPRHNTKNTTDEEREFETIYKNKKFLARGHMTSAVWKDIDPEINYPNNIDFPECATQPGFSWIDGEIINEENHKKFSQCDVRTEFVPMYSIPSPNWSSWRGNTPIVCEAKKYAEQYDPKIIRKWLEPFDTEYRRWIDGLENTAVQYDSIKANIIEAAKNTHRRLTAGINFICTNDNARLAFCFASRAIDEQSKWSRRDRKGMDFRPFQLAFILTTVESILNPKSNDRDVCDLLWVPTGSGKTEAYLFLVAMTAAYRRLESTSKFTSDSGAGVSIISRYTLRLLTTQQFRRTLSLFVAMEYLRVYNLNKKKMIGWRPEGVKNTKNFLWGSTQFSVGLWVGGGLTPNKLESGLRPGALDILRRGNKSSNSDPAQILNCPACKAVLSITNEDQTNVTEIHYVVKTDATYSDVCRMFSNANLFNSNTKPVITKHITNNIFTWTFQINSQIKLSQYWDKARKILHDNKFEVELLAASPSKPGYFIRSYITSQKNKKDYDFDIFCPNPNCELKVDWVAGTPAGRVHNKVLDLNQCEKSTNGIHISDGNYFVDINDAFAKEEFVADRIPIPAFTVDDQLYRNIPTMIVSTVDKFAQLPFKPESASLFGNVDHYHSADGYFRKSFDGEKRHAQKLRSLLDSPDLIIQDELHLIDGPLGSMVGIYETAIDYLCKRSKNVKYIASTATIKRANEHTQSVFARNVQIFPPTGLSSDDRFFIHEGERHPLDDNEPGRLYLGICAPGRGSQTPIVRIWSRLAQTAYEHKEHGKIDPFWTLVGYFNSIRELAGARALYTQDIPEWIKHISPNKTRELHYDGGVELSGRTPSTKLPAILERLKRNHLDPGTPDVLFTTSMFGTGVDVPRIGMMFVNGQPKTTSSYIQSTGRVGRKYGGIVVTFYRASRPRDLNHYEFFVRHHRQLHRFVESPTVFPFAKGARNRALGPVMVGILRNIKESSSTKEPMCTVVDMSRHDNKDEVKRLPEIFAERSQKQPLSRRPVKDNVINDVRVTIDKWRSLSDKHNELKYNEYGIPKKPVVLGDSKHHHKNILTVYSNVPQSMRNVEEGTGFET